MFNREKFKNLVRYVCWKCENNTTLGAIKLNKVLLYSERAFYLRSGEPLTGETFVKRQFGPAPLHVLEVLRELQDEHIIAIKDTIEYGKSKRRFINLNTDPDLSMFTKEELAIVDRVAQDICWRHTARSISDKTHDDIWEMAEMGQEIPLFTVYAVQGEVDETDFAWAKSEVAQLEGVHA
jgi:Protein of unknown function (DUF4065)